MNSRPLLSLCSLVICCLSAQICAEPLEDLSVAATLGTFDMDTDDSDGPHLNELSYGAILTWQPVRIFAMSAEWLELEEATDTDVFGEFTSFAARGPTVSVSFRWPMAEDLAAYLRAGASRLSVDDNSVLQNRPLSGAFTQPVYGVGLEGKNWFVEYTNYGTIDELHLEQVRAGLVFRFKPR